MNQATGLYGWIRSNDGRSTGLFVGLVLAVQVVAAVVLFLPLTLFDTSHAPFLAWGGYLLRYAPLVLVASLLWFGWELFWHIETVKKAVGFRFVDDSEEPRLCGVIEPLIIMLGLPVPFVGVIESPARNAFACGIGRKKAVIVVTRGLLDSLDDEELACVLGHELSHIKNGDIRLMAAANIFMSALARMNRSNPLQFTPVHAVLAIAVPAVLPLTLLGSFLGHAALRGVQVSRLLIASSREFIADAEAVQLTKNPGAMASALIKVEDNYRIKTARREDDAMMIAGDTVGENATHPTVAQRIAALARTTGSMVFNGPSAPRQEDWSTSASLSDAEAAALLRQVPPERALPRVQERSQRNWLGLDRMGKLMALTTVLSLGFIHWEEFDDPGAIAAKFDVRPISLMVGTPFSCQFELTTDPQACNDRFGGGTYKDFEGQRNTLAGYLAQASRERRDAGVVDADMTLASMGGSRMVRRAYTGQSGRLKGVFQESTGDGLFASAGGGTTSKAPEPLEIAEIEGVGCFPGAMFYGDRDGHYPLGTLSHDKGVLERYETAAANSLIARGLPGTPGYDEGLRAYAKTRELMIHASYDHWGKHGLRAMQLAYAKEGHADLVGRIGERLNDPAFTRGMAALDLAKIKSLARASDKFVPCLALRHDVI